jgi:hypothetical protein
MSLSADEAKLSLIRFPKLPSMLVDQFIGAGQ